MSSFATGDHIMQVTTSSMYDSNYMQWSWVAVVNRKHVFYQKALRYSQTEGSVPSF